MTIKSEDKDTFENDLVSLTVHRKPQCIVEYEVKASKTICSEAHKKAAKSVGKGVVVPGFRRGKAPIEIVAKRHPQELDKHWQEAIANRCYQECARLANVATVNQKATIRFEMKSHSHDGAHLTLSFETIPSIPVVDPAKCLLEEVERPEVSAEKIEETIRQTQMFFGQWDKAEDRPVKEGDFVLLDVKIIDEEPPEELFSGTRFEVTDRTMAKWMKALVLGKSPGDVIEGVSEPDEELTDEEKKDYPPRKVRVTIKQIDEVELPELDATFAEKLGVESVAELRTRIEEILNKKADEHVRERHRQQATDFLLSHHFEVPRSVVEEETKFRLQQMIASPRLRLTWELSSQQEREKTIDQSRLHAEKAVRIFYLCHKIADDQNIEVTSEQTASAQVDPIESLLYPTDPHHDPRQPNVKQAETYSRMLLETTEDWIIAHSRTAPKKEAQEPSETLAPKEAVAEEGKEKAKRKAAPKKDAQESSETPAPKEAAAEEGKEKAKRKAAPKKTAAKKPTSKAAEGSKPKRKAAPKPKKDA